MPYRLLESRTRNDPTGWERRISSVTCRTKLPKYQLMADLQVSQIFKQAVRGQDVEPCGVSGDTLEE